MYKLLFQTLLLQSVFTSVPSRNLQVLQFVTLLQIHYYASLSNIIRKSRHKKDWISDFRAQKPPRERFISASFFCSSMMPGFFLGKLWHYEIGRTKLCFSLSTGNGKKWPKAKNCVRTSRLTQKLSSSMLFCVFRKLYQVPLCFVSIFSALSSCSEIGN